MQSSSSIFLASAVDLVCCALGGSILLFIISAAAVDETRIESDTDARVLAVRLLKNKGANAEVRLEWRKPGQTNWVFGTRNADFFSAKSSQGGGNALAVIRNPDPGRWHFRGYYVDYESQGVEPGEGARQSSKISVRYKVYGNFKPEKNLEPQDLKRPSSYTPLELRVYVPPGSRKVAALGGRSSTTSPE